MAITKLGKELERKKKKPVRGRVLGTGIGFIAGDRLGSAVGRKISERTLEDLNHRMLSGELNYYKYLDKIEGLKRKHFGIVTAGVGLGSGLGYYLGNRYDNNNKR